MPKALSLLIVISLPTHVSADPTTSRFLGFCQNGASTPDEQRTTDALKGAALSIIKTQDTRDCAAMDRALRLSDTLVLRGQGLTTLAQISDFNQLTELDVSGNALTDLSPLSGMTKLLTLLAASNQITSMAPLGSLRDLFHLDLSANRLTKIEGMSKDRNLARLILDQNQITDISDLDNARGMFVVSLTSNRLSALNLVSGYAAEMFLDYNTITTITGVPKYTNMIDLSGNSLSDASRAILARWVDQSNNEVPHEAKTAGDGRPQDGTGRHGTTAVVTTPSTLATLPQPPVPEPPDDDPHREFPNPALYMPLTRSGSFTASLTASSATYPVNTVGSVQERDSRWFGQDPRVCDIRKKETTPYISTTRLLEGVTETNGVVASIVDYSSGRGRLYPSRGYTITEAIELNSGSDCRGVITPANAQYNAVARLTADRAQGGRHVLLWIQPFGAPLQNGQFTPITVQVSNAVNGVPWRTYHLTTPGQHLVVDLVNEDPDQKVVFEGGQFRVDVLSSIYISSSSPADKKNVGAKFWFSLVQQD